MSEKTPPNARTYRLDESTRDAVYQDRIAPQLFGHLGRSRAPSLTIIAGQHGPHREAVRDALQLERGARPAAVIADHGFNHKHPQYAFLSRTQPDKADSFTQADADRWKARALEDVRARGVDTVLETDLNQPADLTKQIADFKRAGFRVELRALAVPARESLQSLHTERETRAQLGFGPTSVDRRSHDKAFAALPDGLRAIEQTSQVDRVSVVRADGQAVYDNQRVGQTWTLARPLADRALTIERERPRTLAELQNAVIELEHNERLVTNRTDATGTEISRVVNALAGARAEYRASLLAKPAPSREAATRASIRAAQEIAERLGGDNAKLRAPLSGRAYAGPILGATKDHLVQGGRNAATFYVHAKRELPEVPSVGTIVEIRYPADRKQQATVTDLQRRGPDREARPPRNVDLDR